MKIKVCNLGILRQAEFTLGDLTIICGGNNTGKTYATYTLFGFLLLWRQKFSIEIPDQTIDQLLTHGVIQVNVQDYIHIAQDVLSQACKVYTQELHRIFATPVDRFENTTFSIDLDFNQINLELPYNRQISSEKISLLSLFKESYSLNLVITLLVEKIEVKLPIHILKNLIADSLKEIIFAPLLPRPFIASAERTGAAIFRKELNFARNRLLEEMGQVSKDINPLELLLKEYEDYALPVKMNIDFTRNLETIAKKTSFLQTQYPAILENFSDIIGGEYTVTRHDELYFLPRHKKGLKLSMDESSSAVRSLLDLGFYLRHEAQTGDLLLIDEPELNLHPENQRRIARLVARLIHVGIKVFMTTHSDYLIKELSTLIMLNQEDLYVRSIAEREGYCTEELLNIDQVRVYIAQEEQVLLEGKRRKTKIHTLVPANIDQQLGIEVQSFDSAIETMNRIQSAILWREV